MENDADLCFKLSVALTVPFTFDLMMAFFVSSSGER